MYTTFETNQPCYAIVKFTHYVNTPIKFESIVNVYTDYRRAEEVLSALIKELDEYDHIFYEIVESKLLLS